MSIAKVLLAATLIFPQIGLADTELTEVKGVPTVLGGITNVIAALGGFYTLSGYRALYRKQPKQFPVSKMIKGVLICIQVAGNGLYLAGHDTKLSKNAGDAILMRDTAKLASMSLYGLTHYGSNLFVERTGLARLFYLYDLWCLYGYGAEVLEHRDAILREV